MRGHGAVLHWRSGAGVRPRCARRAPPVAPSLPFPSLPSAALPVPSLLAPTGARARTLLLSSSVRFALLPRLAPFGAAHASGEKRRHGSRRTRLPTVAHCRPPSPATPARPPVLAGLLEGALRRLRRTESPAGSGGEQHYGADSSCFLVSSPSSPSPPCASRAALTASHCLPRPPTASHTPHASHPQARQQRRYTCILRKLMRTLKRCCPERDAAACLRLCSSHVSPQAVN